MKVGGKSSGSLILAAVFVLVLATPAQAPVFRSERDKRAAAVCEAAMYQAAGKAEDAADIIRSYKRQGKQPLVLVGAAVAAAQLRRTYAPMQIMDILPGLRASQPETAYWLTTCFCLENQSFWDNDCT